MKWTAILLILWFCDLGFAAETTAFHFAPQNQESPVIVVGKDATASERFAAEELANHLQQITHRPYTIVDDSKPLSDHYIAVGESKLTGSVSPRDLKIEQYVIDVTPTHMMIVGGKQVPQLGEVNDRGTLYGVYDVLELLGVRWYRPEEWGSYIPDTPDPQLPVGKTTSKVPDYVMRSSMGSGFQQYRQPVSDEMLDRWRLWAVRNRLNWHEVGGNPKFGGSVQFQFEHSYFQYINGSEYFEKHPEYFALIKGKRVPSVDSHSPQLCLSNPGLQEEFARKVIAKAKANPNFASISVDPNDGDGPSWCQCDQCRAMDDPKHPAVMSNRVCKFNNIIAQRLAKEVPAARIQWLAYSAHTLPPTNVDQLEPNEIVQLAPINEWSDYSHELFDTSSDPNKLFLSAVQRWHSLKPAAIMTYEYWGGYGWVGPAPIVHAIADRLRNYRKFNVTGIYSESEPSWGPQGINLYFTPKLLWNPDLDLDRELQLYYTNYYGPAAKPMKAYHEALMKAVANANPGISSGNRGMHLLFTPKFVAELGGYMSEAQSLSKGREPFERRVHGDWAGYEFARRVSNVIATRKREGTLVERGRGNYYKSEKADKQYDEEVLKFVLGFWEGDAIFDFNLKAPDYGTLGYVREDVMENRCAGHLREEDLLKGF